MHVREGGGLRSASVVALAMLAVVLLPSPQVLAGSADGGSSSASGRGVSLDDNEQDAQTGTVTLFSDTTWEVSDSTGTFLGFAQNVCLNDMEPPNCPAGATLYGYGFPGGWAANLSSIPGATWIWAPGVTGETSPASPAEFSFSKVFDLPEVFSVGTISIAADDFAEVRVNGMSAGITGSVTDESLAGAASSTLATFDILPFLLLGTNVIEIRGANGQFGCDSGPYSCNPAGVVFGGSLTQATPPLPPVLIAADLVGAAWGDVTLTWTPSADEGDAGGTVVYRVLRAGSDPAGPYSEVSEVPADGSLAYQHTCVGCGHSPVDTNHSFFKVQAVDAANTTADSNLGAKYAQVTDGRHLLTVPVAMSNASFATVLQTLGTEFTGAWTYDATDVADPWKAYSATKGRGDLVTLPLGATFWVDTAAPGVYTVAGLLVDNPTVTLQPGWNLVAYASLVPEARDVSLAAVGGVTKVQTFDAPPPYHLRSVPATEALVWGEAFWIYTTSGSLWVQG